MLIKKNLFVLRFLLPTLFFLIPISIQAQFNLEGQVRDADTGLPVQAFELKIDSTTASFSNGIFRIEANTAPKHLVITSPGYLPFKLSDFQKKMKLNIYLIPENVNVEEVVIKAFQSEKRLLDTPGSINLITNRQLL